jgi:hypothetical protein
LSSTRLPENVRARIDAQLDAVDAELRSRYPGPDGRVQPIHTAYVPADQATAETPGAWGAAATELLDRHYELLMRALVAREPIPQEVR